MQKETGAYNRYWYVLKQKRYWYVLKQKKNNNENKIKK